MPTERVQKILARAGVASRRAVEDLIRQGRVTVNGQRIELGAQADPATDELRVDGALIKAEAATRIYIMLNKPPGVVSTAKSQTQDDRQTVLDLVPLEARLYPVGRLDAESEGLILLTNDGDITQKLTHPRYGHAKVYRVLVTPPPSAEQLDQWRKGVALEEGRTAPAEVHTRGNEGGGTWLEITIREGRKRQIRRTAIAIGLHVRRLIRTQLGPLTLSGVAPGAWRYLDDEEIRALKRSTAGGRPGGKKSGGQKRRGKKPSSRSRHRGTGASSGGKRKPTSSSRRRDKR